MFTRLGAWIEDTREFPRRVLAMKYGYISNHSSSFASRSYLTLTTRPRDVSRCRPARVLRDCEQRMTRRLTKKKNRV